MNNNTKDPAFSRSREGIKWPLIDQAFDKVGAALFGDTAAAGLGAATGVALGGPLWAAIGSAAGIVIGRQVYTMAVDYDRVSAERKYGAAIVKILEHAFNDELKYFSPRKGKKLSEELKSRRDALEQHEVKIEHQAFGQLSEPEIYYGLEKSNIRKFCKQLGGIDKIRISVPVIHAATISAL